MNEKRIAIKLAVASLAGDYSKASFTVLFLGGIAALFIKPSGASTIDILAAIGIGALLTIFFALVNISLKSKSVQS
jgi:hypothetical protein